MCFLRQRVLVRYISPFVRGRPTTVPMEPVDPPPARYTEALAALASRCSSHVVLPNHARAFLEPPTGNVLVWPADAPFDAGPCYANLFRGVAVKEVHFPKAAASGAPPPPAEVLRRLADALPVHAARPPRVHTDDPRGYDRAPWDASLGDRRSWAGLFSVRTKAGTAQWVDKYFVGVRAGLDAAAYEELEGLLRAEEARGASFRAVFGQSKAVARARALARRNRRRLLRLAAAAVGALPPSGLRQDAAAVDRPEMVDPDVETETNYAKLVGDTCVFYHGATCAEDARGGVVLARAPQLGPVVLQGPPSAQVKRGALFRGGPWKNAVFSAFPTTMGPAVPAAATTLTTPPGRFAGDVSVLRVEHRRRTSPAWQRAEAALGYRADAWPLAEELVPYAVFLGPASFGDEPEQK
jgi:hypothetical protein